MKKPVTILFQLFLIIGLITGCGSKQKNKPPQAPKKSIANAISDNPNSPVEARIALYFKLKEEESETYNFNDQNELNNLGYQLLGEGKIKDAIEIFKLLVSEFPNAANPYDSLAEAYHMDGNETMAIKNYERSLILDPKNINAEDWINRLKYTTYDSTRFSKRYPLKQYKEDLDELGRRLSEVHPNVYKFISKDEFWKAIETKKEQLTDTTTFSEFIWHCSEIIANINCSHTSMGYFAQERKMIPAQLRFPLEIRLINNIPYVTDPLINENKIAPKNKVSSINGIPFDSIKKEIYKHISSQGTIETYKKSFLNAHVTSIIPYALGFPKTYTVQLENNPRPVTLNMLSDYRDNFQKLPGYLCEGPLCTTYLKDGKTAIMSIRSFAYYGNKFPEYKAFMDRNFNDFAKKGIQNLIIDVRGNGGGSSDASIYLLRYLSPEPFTYFSDSQFNENLSPLTPFENGFNGNLYVTMDGNGGSTTGHFMSIVKHLKLATLIGEELGSNQFCTGGQKRLRLPHTGIEYTVGRNTYVTTATRFPIDQGIMPDHTVFQSIDAYLGHTDTVMEYAIDLLEKK